MENDVPCVRVDHGRREQVGAYFYTRIFLHRRDCKKSRPFALNLSYKDQQIALSCERGIGGLARNAEPLLFEAGAGAYLAQLVTVYFLIGVRHMHAIIRD